jgi:hypothetical protein
VAHLPLDHKHLIQTSYVRFRELAKEVPEVDRLLTLGKVAHWGGLAVLVVWFVRMFIGHNELPDWLGGVGIAAFIFGWAYETDQRKKQQSLWQEQEQIRKEMKALGIYFSNALDSVNVYAGRITEENTVSPLHDGAYK